MNFLYFVFVSLIWVSTQGRFSVLTETTETGPTDPPNTQESQETPSTAPENTDSTTEPMTEEKALEICNGMFSCRSDTEPDQASGKYLCNAPVEHHSCLDDCRNAVVDDKCGNDTECIMGKLSSDCKCDKDRYMHGFHCRDVTPEQTKEQKVADACEQMDSCNQDAKCDWHGNCVCPGSSKNGIACKVICHVMMRSGFLRSGNFYIHEEIAEDCLCKKGYMDYSSEVPCEAPVTEAPPVVTETTTETPKTCFDTEEIKKKCSEACNIIEIVQCLTMIKKKLDPELNQNP